MDVSFKAQKDGQFEKEPGMFVLELIRSFCTQRLDHAIVKVVKENGSMWVTALKAAQLLSIHGFHAKIRLQLKTRPKIMKHLVA